ncbi:MAG: HNH endonuclease [Limisphaerales bacterium]
MPELMRDFGGRCAYSMQHQSRSGALEVDHFDPRLKKELIQDYSNLFPASRHCNGKKSDIWPGKEELAAGCRFLNPCEEMDYGEQIFEDAATHRLIGTTPAAIWHVRVCGLNADHLVFERRRRAEHWTQIKRTAVLVRGNQVEVGRLIRKYREEVELMIPEIPAVSDRAQSH